MSSQATRKHPRYAVEVTLQLRSGDGTVEGRTKNVSRGGLAALSEQPMTPGTGVELHLSLVFDEETFSEPLVLPARVVWCTPLGDGQHQIGTAFLGLDSQRADYLHMFLRYLREGQEAAAPPEGPAENDPFGG